MLKQFSRAYKKNTLAQNDWIVFVLRRKSSQFKHTHTIYTFLWKRKCCFRIGKLNKKKRILEIERNENINKEI